MCRGCKTVIGLELELARISLLGSLSNLPLDLGQVLLYGKVGWF